MTRHETSRALRRQRPAGSRKALFRLACSGSLLTLLAACAGTPSRPTIPVAEEAADYRAHAQSYYAPPGPPDDPWGPYIEEASKRFDVPDPWIRAVMHQESGGHQFRITGTLTTSPVGAMGLMQLMPPTYDDMRVQYNLGSDAFEPHDNIMAGTAYIRQMYDIYGSPGFLAAYNTGPGRLDDFLTRNRPLPRETRDYVAVIGPQIAGISPGSRSQADLLVASHSTGVQYAAAQSSQETHSVRMAWAKRRDLNQGADQPVQVAEAPESAAAPAPAYTRAWNPVRVAAAQPVSRPEAPVADVHAADVRAAWASRTVAVASAAPVASQPAPASEPAPAPAPAIAAAPAAVPEVRLADAEPPAPRAPRERFRLIRQAMAEPAPLLRDSGHSARNWAVQVGAFGSPAQASEAADAAQSRSTILSHARPEIAGIRQSHGARLYRARLTGLSRGDAMQACERISRGRAGCIVVSPDA